MKSPNKKLVVLYYRILDYYLSGSTALTVLNMIRQQYEGQSITHDDIFLTTMVNSTYNTTILSLANIIKPHKESVSLDYLITCVKDSKDLFDVKTKNRFLSFVDEINYALSIISTTIERVTELRDKSVAHLDRKHINNPSFFLKKPPMKWDELATAYSVVGSAILEIGKYLDLDNNMEDIIRLADFALTKRTLQVLSFLNESVRKK
jgi:hypothetical protein